MPLFLLNLLIKPVCKTGRTTADLPTCGVPRTGPHEEQHLSACFKMVGRIGLEPMTN